MIAMTVWCESCQGKVPFFIEEMHSDKYPENGIWGDMVCAMCRLIICSFGSERPGPVTMVVGGEAVRALEPHELSEPDLSRIHA